jgi:hypothetical protein
MQTNSPRIGMMDVASNALISRLALASDYAVTLFGRSNDKGPQTINCQWGLE